MSVVASLICGMITRTGQVTMKIELATSLAGHDKGNIYIISQVSGDEVLLVNGENRTVEHPKRKKLKHIQVIKRLPEDVQDLAAGMDELSDLSAKRLLKLYRRNDFV